MSDVTAAGDVESVERELRQYVELGFLQYYLPTIPPGERYVVGMDGRIVIMSPEETMAFLLGATMAAQGMLRHRAQLRGLTDV